MLRNAHVYCGATPILVSVVLHRGLLNWACGCVRPAAATALQCSVACMLLRGEKLLHQFMHTPLCSTSDMLRVHSPNLHCSSCSITAGARCQHASA